MPENIYDQVGSVDMSGDADQPLSADEHTETLSTGGKRSNPYRMEVLRSNLFLVALFITGAAVVYGLSWGKGPQKVSAEEKLVEAQVDSAILRLSQQASNSSNAPRPGQITKEILHNFQERMLKSQIPLQKLRKNPFVFVQPIRKPTISIVHKEPDKKNSSLNQRETQEDVINALKKLHLQSVLIGRNGATAIISNNLLTVGQRIEGFTIESITPRQVVLSRRGKRYILTVE